MRITALIAASAAALALASSAGATTALQESPGTAGHREHVPLN